MRSSRAAVLGVAAKLGGCPDRHDFFRWLLEKRSFVSELSAERRALSGEGSPRWSSARVPGNFLPDVDCFDAGLFGIPPSAALFSDPRQRLLLEVIWAAIEDAGLCRADLAGRRVGVFVAHDGWYLGSYANRIPSSQRDAQEFIVPGNAPSFLANRISAVFDLQGPSMVFDATCSGTYVAAHHARLSLARGECEYALVAGVTLFLDPWRAGEASATPFESASGEVASFSRRATGYRTAEGCGAMLLTAGEHELTSSASPYCSIIGSGQNCAGKTASFARPRAEQLVQLFREVLSDAGLQAADVRYVEAHGIGALLGDAIEAAALREVFAVGAREPCLVSTLKPNWGHAHAASGIYSLLKVIGSLEHGAIAPIRGLTEAELNEEISSCAELSFLYDARPWPSGPCGSRRAFLSSYGMSNVNAALVVEDASTARREEPPPTAELICISARGASQLLHQLQQLREHVSRTSLGVAPSLADVAHTLQVGRELLRVRWAACCTSLADLAQKIEQFLEREPLSLGARGVPGVLAADGPLASEAGSHGWSAELLELAHAWFRGERVTWPARVVAPHRVHLPTYPFAKDRYWVAANEAEPQVSEPALSLPEGEPAPALVVDLDGEDFFLADHRIQEQRILPAVMHLEYARQAVARTRPKLSASEQVRLTELVWLRPLLVTEAASRRLTVSVTADEQRSARGSFAIRSAIPGREPVLHSTGKWSIEATSVPAKLELGAIRAACNEGEQSAEILYDLAPHLRLEIGPRLRGAEHVFFGPGQVLAKLRLPGEMSASLHELELHPSLFDPVLQLAYLALVARGRANMPLTIPFALQEITLFGACSAEMWVWLRYAPGSQPGSAVERLDLDLCDNEGVVQSTWRGFSFRALVELGRFESEALTAPPQLQHESSAASQRDPARAWLARVAADVLGISIEQLDFSAGLEDLGVDSLLAIRLIAAMERVLGPLPKTLLFEFRNLEQLAQSLAASYAQAFSDRLVPASSAPLHPALAGDAERSITPPLAEANGLAPIAIVGLAGRYPKSPTLHEFWQNLERGVDCITEIPRSRWDVSQFELHEPAGPVPVGKWGGFLDHIDHFDPLFFGIPPREAELLDPQERLFLQCCWSALEDAGYTRAQLLPSASKGTRRGGVYAGVMYGQYQLFGVEETLAGNPLGFASTLASIANRVSYVLDLHGPSMVVDTKCSSSLTAIHLACQDLRLRTTDIAFAGGVNLSLHPAKYLELSRRRFLSSTGRCQSFGEGGDGYVPGEGVGVVLLKRLSDAVRDGDHIHAVIRGSAINHGGKTNGYTVPDPNSQASVISEALQRSGVPASSLSYIEAHGTGTKLGDPIEVDGLERAFAGHDGEAPRAVCWLGSVKSNIGHCEAAAGIAGLTKILLQLRNQQLAPSLHAEPPNPAIDLSRSRFRVCRALEPWPAFDGAVFEAEPIAGPRTAGISSFGAGGSNAHLIVQEFAMKPRTEPADKAHWLPLSAKTEERLRARAVDLFAFVSEPKRRAAVRFDELAFTLQVGREAMSARIVFRARSFDELTAQLARYLEQGKPAHDDLPSEVAGWLRGEAFDWALQWPDETPRRASLPTYPFAPERHWFRKRERALEPRALAHALHPLLQRNLSSFDGLRYCSHFDGQEWFFADHRFRGEPVLSAAASLELVRAALAAALGPKRASIGATLSEVVWHAPLRASGAPVRVEVELESSGPEHSTAFRFRTSFGVADGVTQVHASGRIDALGSAAPSINCTALRARLSSGSLSAVALYERLAAGELAYGASHQSVRELFVVRGEALVRLELPGVAVAGAESLCDLPYGMHPAFLDGALQGLAALGATGDGRPRALELPFALAELRLWRPTPERGWAWLRPSQAHRADAPSFDLDLCDDSGQVAVALRGLALRALNREAPIAASFSSKVILAAPRFEPVTFDERAFSPSSAEHWIALCGFARPALELNSPLARALWRPLPAAAGSEAFIEQSVALLELLQELRRTPGEPRLLQVVVPTLGEFALAAGLSGMLESAALEHPSVRVQLVAVDPGMDAAALVQTLTRAASSVHSYLRQVNGVLCFRRFEALPEEPANPRRPWREDGTYLISGGLGGLGRIFARDILLRTSHTRVVLVGRSAPRLHALRELQALSGPTERLSYELLDVCDANAVAALVDSILLSGSLHGVLHSAGVLADRLLVNKNASDVRVVLAPKVLGAQHLDEATAHLDLDCFVLFSSLASVASNLGQADYAAANAFLNEFARIRRERVARRERSGKSLSVAWPLWEEGGMRMPAERAASIAESIGLTALSTHAGVEALSRALSAGAPELLVLSGDATRLQAWLGGLGSHRERVPAAPLCVEAPDRRDLADALRHYLADLVCAELKLPASRIERDTPFGEYGLESVAALALTQKLEAVCGKLSGTLLFEHGSLGALTAHLLQAHESAWQRALLPGDPGVVAAAARAVTALPVVTAMASAPSVRATALPTRATALATRAAGGRAESSSEPIAVIGVSGRYAGAGNVRELWQNLCAGRDAIHEVPSGRWHWQDYSHGNTGRHAGKWGGFIDDVAGFDAALFGISASEAKTMDPHERLVLEAVWAAIEDAGYVRRELTHDDERLIGTYVGAMSSEYPLVAAEATPPAPAIAANLAGIANRVSHFFDFRGPSLTVESMCSSALAALHLACRALRDGEIALAVTAGVNLILHPARYSALTAIKLLSNSSKCQSFGLGSAGYVPGEGVGVVLLKRLSDAERDGDTVLGLIRASAINHGGRGNGYFAPSPSAQRLVLERALLQAGLSAERVSYLEAHATGTTLGDAIELSSLTQVFRRFTSRVGFCRLGSIKSNLGHSEAASGMASLTKVLLQLEHRSIAPSLHADTKNPNVDFSASPFIVNETLVAWPNTDLTGFAQTRVAGISAFGAGGSNAHVLIEEHCRESAGETGDVTTPCLLPLSAPSEAQLRVVAHDVLDWLRAPCAGEPPALTDIAFTLQVGRECFDERLGFVVESRAELAVKLERFLSGQGSAEAVRGRIGADSPLLAALSGELPALTEGLIAQGKWQLLMQLWLNGAPLDFRALHTNARRRRVRLPGYSFSRQARLISSPLETESTSLEAVAASTSGAGLPPPEPARLAVPDGSSTLAERAEAWVVTVLRNVLGERGRELQAHSSFRDAPLESLQVVGFVSLWQTVVGTTLPLELLYEAESPRALARELVRRGLSEDDLTRIGANLAVAGRTGAAFDLLPMQQAFLVGRRLKTAGRLVSSSLCFELALPAVSIGTLSQAWSMLLARHDSLRLYIDSDFRQRVAEQVPRTPIRELDLRRESADERQRIIDRERARLAFRSFDLEAPPYFELQLLTLAGGESRVQLVLDEMVADALSAHLLLQQLSALCSAPGCALPALTYSYESYVRYLLGLSATSGSQASVAYWATKLSGLPAAPALECAREVDSSRPPVHCLEATLPADAWERLKQEAARAGCQPAALLLSLFAEALAEHTGQPAFRLAITKLNRLPVHADVQQLLGLFATSNVFVHRPTGAELWSRVREAQQQLDRDAPHAHLSALQSLRLARVEGAASALPVVFSSFIGSTFAILDQSSARTVFSMNTTPNVLLDHHTFERKGDLHFRWYAADAIVQSGAAQALLISYEEKLRALATAPSLGPLHAEGVSARPQRAAIEIPMTDVQSAYAFGRRAGHELQPCALHLEFELELVNLEKLRACWNALVREHAALRMIALATGTLRVLEEVPEYRISHQRETTIEAFEQRCQVIRQELLGRSYALDEYPAYALSLCSQVGGRSRLFLNVDLVLIDPPGVTAIAHQLLASYCGATHAVAAPRVAPSAVRYEPPASTEAQRQAAARYWQDKLSALPEGPALRSLGAGSRERHQLVRKLTCLAGLRARAERLGVELDAVLLAAFGETLLAWNGERSCAVVVAGFERVAAGGATLPIGDSTRLGWVAFAGPNCHVDAAIVRVQAALDADARHGAVSGLGALRRRAAFSLPAVYTRAFERSAFSGAELSFALSLTPGVIVDCVPEVRGDELWLHWDSVAAERSREAAHFEAFCELLEICAGASPREANVKLPHSGLTLFELLEQAMARYAGRPALGFAGKSLSYAELEERSRRSAEWLLEQGVSADDVVIVLMDRSLELVVALLAILRAGAAYLPLDPAAPELRLEELGRASGARCVLWKSSERQLPPELRRLACHDFCAPPAPLGPAPSLASRRTDEQSLAYVIYTSGSTGKPKGCMIEQRSIVNRLAWMQDAYGLGESDVVLQKTPYTFDVSVWEFFWPLLVGAKLVLAKPSGHLDPDYLLDLIERERVTICHFVPSMLRLLLDQPRLERLASLRRVVVSGEALDYDLFEKFQRQVGIPLENLYGPTETAVDVSHWHCEPNSARRISIGRAIPGVVLYVLNERLELVAPGELGELYIGGVAVGRGYLNNPELTEKSFIEAPFGDRTRLYRTGDLARQDPDGNLIYLGRRDGQVKLNGLRIELGEIEHALRGADSVEDVMVTLEQVGSDKVLVAYVVVRGGQRRFDREALRSFLRTRLPAQLMPHSWIAVDAIPLTAHGKRTRPVVAPLTPAASTGANGKNGAAESSTLGLLRGIS